MNRVLIGAGDKLPLLLHLTQQDFPTGVTVIDPDDTFAPLVGNSTPEEFTEDVLYFDPSDETHVASFNVFERVLEKDKLVQDLIAFFDTLFPAGAETLTKQTANYVLANILTILSDNKNISFLSILTFLSDSTFRKDCLSNCTNDIALRNWAAIEEWDKTQKKAAYSQIEIKVGTLLLSPVLYRTLEDRSTFYLGKTKLFIANLSREKLGDYISTLLGTLLISRSHTPVYINNFGFFSSDYLASLFSRGGYTIAVQSLSQLSKNVQQTVLQFEEKYVFRSTLEDAEKLKYAAGIMEPKILVEQNDHEFLPKLKIDPPLARKRLKATIKRSIATHTRAANGCRDEDKRGKNTLRRRARLDGKY